MVMFECLVMLKSKTCCWMWLASSGEGVALTVDDDSATKYEISLSGVSCYQVDKIENLCHMATPGKAGPT